MSDRTMRQKQFTECKQRIYYLIQSEFFFTDDARELEKLSASFHEISRLAMSAAKLAEEAAQEARRTRPALEPD